MDEPDDPTAELASEAERSEHEWTSVEDGREWRARSADASEEAAVRVSVSSFEARVYLRPTGPEQGSAWKLAHGPVVFERAADAVRYCEERISP